jgi:PmbA protein
MGERVASPLVTMVDDPLLHAGPGSRPFDGDGLPARRNVVVEGGVLKTWLLDTYGARKLGLKSTGQRASSTGRARACRTSSCSRARSRTRRS